MLKKWISNEEGYLLLESLVTLSMLVAIILGLYPLIIDWLVLRDTERALAEHTRILYEESIKWQSEAVTRNYEGYYIQTSPNSLKITKNNQTIGVDIYEATFE